MIQVEGLSKRYPGQSSPAVDVRVGGTTIQARAGSRLDLERGDRAYVELPPDAIQLFRLDGEPGAVTTDPRSSPASLPA
jgi:hypothetical protein